MISHNVPFRQFVLKVHSRCDLACDHCYIYEHADQSWRGRPKGGISSETAAQTARRIAEHAARNELPHVRVVLHGGEPLLLGVSRTKDILETLRRVVDPVTRLSLQMHTNGVRLSSEFLDLFAAYDVKLGISLDGGRAANDLHRLDHRGRSSYDRVTDALALLRKPNYRHLYSGILATVDLRNDPCDVYHSLLEHEPPRIDFLLPHATWQNQPPGLDRLRDLARPRSGPAPYALWLNKIFVEWNRAGRPVPIRTFDSLIALLHGRPNGTESLGLDAKDLLVIEVDGALEQADSLKTAFDGAAATGMDVVRNSFDEAAAHPGINARQGGAASLSPTCRACPAVAVCGGGLYAHRYDGVAGFDNPSVYCADLYQMVATAADEEALPLGNPTAAAAAPQPYSLSISAFDTLAAGYGGPEVVEVLEGAQRSIRRILLGRIATSGPQEDRAFTRAWDLLDTLDRRRPEAVEATLTHPYNRVWAVRCLEASDSGEPVESLGGDYGRLAAITASAYLGAHESVSLTLPAQDGLVHLPGIGALPVDPGARKVSIQIENGQRVTATWDSQSRTFDLLDPTQGWHPVRRLSADGLTVALEDLDPYRTCHGHAAARLSDADFLRWQTAFPSAIAFIDEFLPRYAPGLRAGLNTLMPMTAPEQGGDRSSAVRYAFGAVGAALPDDPRMLALLLVHEYQHVKLGAILDLYELFDPADVEARYYAPWRPDPRPLEGLLQGTYAHLAVTEFWRILRQTTSGQAATATAAETQFARWRTHTAEAVDELQRSGSLTALGARLVAAMGETVAPWLDEPVSAAARLNAERDSAEHRARFEERRRGLG